MDVRSLADYIETGKWITRPECAGRDTRALRIGGNHRKRIDPPPAGARQKPLLPGPLAVRAGTCW